MRHLLTHTSGLPAWVPLYLETDDAEDALRYIYQSELENPPGEHYSYSDLGAILLSQVVERVANTSLDAFLKEQTFEPLGMRATQYRPPAGFAPADRPDRERPVAGPTRAGRGPRPERVSPGGCVGTRRSVLDGTGPRAFRHLDPGPVSRAAHRPSTQTPNRVGSRVHEPATRPRGLYQSIWVGTRPRRAVEQAPVTSSTRRASDTRDLPALRFG